MYLDAIVFPSPAHSLVISSFLYWVVLIQKAIYCFSLFIVNLSKTHKRLKERFLIRWNRTKSAHFEEVIFLKLRTTIQQKTVKPSYMFSSLEKVNISSTHLKTRKLEVWVSLCDHLKCLFEAFSRTKPNSDQAGVWSLRFMGTYRQSLWCKNDHRFWNAVTSSP